MTRKTPAEAIAEWKAGPQEDRTPLLRALVEYDCWVPPMSDSFEGDVFGPFCEDMVPLQLENDCWFYVLCSSPEAAELYNTNHGPTGFLDRCGSELFLTPWQSAKEFRIDPGMPHEFVIGEADLPKLREIAETVAVELAWSRMKKNLADPGDLARVANFGSYHLCVAHRGGEDYVFCTVLNDDGHAFLALFTSAEAAAAGWPEIAQRYAGQDPKPATVSGPQIFPTLAQEQVVGFVINYAGPTAPLALPREIFDRIVAELENPAAAAAPAQPEPVASPEQEVTHLSNKGVRLTQTDKKRDAEDCLRRALALAEEKLGAGHPATAICLNNLGDFLSQYRRLPEAEPILRRAVAAQEAQHGPDALETGTALSNLALVLRRLDNFPEAESMYQRVLPIFERGHGVGSTEYGSVLNNLAQVFQHTGRTERAERLMRQVIDIFEKNFGPNHQNVAIALNNLARLLEDAGHPVEAEPLARRHLRIFQIFEDESGQRHIHKETAIANYGDLLLRLGLDRPSAQQRIEDLLRGADVGDLSAAPPPLPNTSAASIATPATPDFDRLSAIANAAGATIGDQDALFGAAFRLSDWHFIARGEMPDVRPYVAANPSIVGGAPMVKAFTDTRRLHAFAAENQLTAANGEALILSLPVAGVLPTLADLQQQGVTHIHFNADRDSYGFYVPLVQLPIIRQHLEKHGLL